MNSQIQRIYTHITILRLSFLCACQWYDRHFVYLTEWWGRVTLMKVWKVYSHYYRHLNWTLLAIVWPAVSKAVLREGFSWDNRKVMKEKDVLQRPIMSIISSAGGRNSTDSLELRFPCFLRKNMLPSLLVSLLLRVSQRAHAYYSNCLPSSSFAPLKICNVGRRKEEMKQSNRT